MVHRTLFGLALVLFVAVSGFAQNEPDAEGSADHPLLTRMPGFYISGYEARDFDKYESYLTGPEAVWEGKTTVIDYYIKTGAKQPGFVQITRNYENAIKKIGGKVLYSAERVLEGKIEKAGAVTYVHVEAFNAGLDYQLVIVEKKGMRQDVVADADFLNTSIAASGKVVVEGLLFVADTAALKPESAPAVDQIVKLLKQNAKLSLYVVGHTANVGSLETGLKLSKDRADAIVAALVAQGIPAARLKAVGVGPYSPAASNRTEEGKAKNRRVELVEM